MYKYCIIETYYQKYSLGNTLPETLSKFLTIKINTATRESSYQLEGYKEKTVKYSEEFTIEEIRQHIYLTVYYDIKNGQYCTYTCLKNLYECTV